VGTEHRHGVTESTDNTSDGIICDTSYAHNQIRSCVLTGSDERGSWLLSISFVSRVYFVQVTLFYSMLVLSVIPMQIGLTEDVTFNVIRHILLPWMSP
jgi:hypothetical protein